ncbi:hypothetical protein [Methylobacterium sp. Leaf106]|uniref:hypothetical protein n=1 Tax=Methylobacterium sp. Leaf106 TaxID=1736255 RepID=UPI0006FF8414|nr:hypothetical protein [Methylobacterium sp. Leaf106]KQP53075.1 hypothetical protein ASF34_01520 [Methylobacterium sp. Leaf106]
MAIEAEALQAILKQHIKVDATGLSPAVASAFVTGFDEAVEAIRSALAEDTARAAEGWEPIETAPRNKAIQVYVPHLDYYGNEGVYAGMLVDMGTGLRWMTFAWAMGRDMNEEVLPTHWRPLPAPPALPLTKEAADANR